MKLIPRLKRTIGDEPVRMQEKSIVSLEQELTERLKRLGEKVTIWKINWNGPIGTIRAGQCSVTFGRLANVLSRLQVEHVITNDVAYVHTIGLIDRDAGREVRSTERTLELLQIAFNEFQKKSKEQWFEAYINEQENDN